MQFRQITVPYTCEGLEWHVHIGTLGYLGREGKRKKENEVEKVVGPKPLQSINKDPLLAVLDGNSTVQTPGARDALVREHSSIFNFVTTYCLYNSYLALSVTETVPRLCLHLTACLINSAWVGVLASKRVPHFIFLPLLKRDRATQQRASMVGRLMLNLLLRSPSTSLFRLQLL